MVAYLDEGGARHLVEKVLDRIQPVGSLYFSASNTSPASLFGGTWERYAQGRAMVSASDTDTDFTVGTTGGSKTHTISQKELPNHIHALPAFNTGDTNYTEPDFTIMTWAYPGQYNQNGVWYRRVGHTITDSSFEETRYPNNPMSVMQPYISVYIWIRRA